MKKTGAVRLTKDDYMGAITVQDACNLSGVVIAFVTILKKIRNEPGCTGTDWINQHPISVLYADKIQSLTGAGDLSSFGVAYDICKEKSK